LYCYTRKKWLIWNGSHWAIDKSGEARRLGKNTVAGIYGEASNLNNETERKAIAKHAIQSESRQHIDAMLNLAESEREFAKTLEDFDQNKWLLGVKNGTINLKTCEFQESKREDMISVCAGTSFDPNAKCERWKAFLKEVLVNDELIAYIQREVGYSLTGDTSEQSFRFLYGSGANGKTVFITVLQDLLGDYAKNTPFTTFLIQRSNSIRNDLATLQNARLVTASEPRKGAKFDLSVLKDWTGSSIITARFLFGENFDFLPQGKIWLIGNHKPIINETMHAAWRRPRLIPFTVEIPFVDQDPLLDKELKKELPGILNWALAGLKEWHKIRSKPPAIVIEATEEYRRESDSIGAFIEARCQIEPPGACDNKTLYQEYKRFCEDTGFDIESQKEFSSYLKKTKGIRRKKVKEVWFGMELI
jgi:phage/plasmid primase, P4 family, C-terminal domain